MSNSGDEDMTEQAPNASTMADYLLLKQKCNAFFGDLGCQENISDASDEPNVILADIAEVEKLKSDFSEASITLVTLASQVAPNEVTELQEARNSFMTKFRAIRNQLLSRLPSTSNNVQNSTTMTATNLKLPKISLPKFSGDFDKWADYKALFESLVLNTSLDDTTKYHYLRTSLEKSALDQISGLPLKPEYFIKAWEILTGYYDDPFNEINLYLKKMHGAKNMSTYAPNERYVGLRELITLFRQNATGLDTLFKKYPDVDPFSQIISYWFLQKCDKRIRFEWNREVKKQENLPDFREFLKFIDAFCKAEEQASTSTSSADQPKNLHGSTSKSIQSTPNKKKFKLITASSSSSQRKQRSICESSREKVYILRRYNSLSYNVRKIQGTSC